MRFLGEFAFSVGGLGHFVKYEQSLPDALEDLQRDQQTRRRKLLRFYEEGLQGYTYLES
jgi:hypothetical protein